jgi:hypothetical protein
MMGRVSRATKGVSRHPLMTRHSALPATWRPSSCHHPIPPRNGRGHARTGLSYPRRAAASAGWNVVIGPAADARDIFRPHVGPAASEPTLGLAPIVIEEIGKALRRFREMHLTVLLIEQNATLTCSMADRIYVPGSGRIRIEDQANAILNAPELIHELI